MDTDVLISENGVEITCTGTASSNNTTALVVNYTRNISQDVETLDREKKLEITFWLSCMNIDEDALSPMVRGERG